jgi:hypothetical protein
MFSYISLEERVPAAHPLRKLRGVVDGLLGTMDREFEAVYVQRGRPSVPPKRLLEVPPARRRRTHESTVDADARPFKKSPGDKGDDCKAFITGCRKLKVTPHVAAKDKHSAVDGRIRRHEGYQSSLKVRKRIKEAFGWIKTVGGLAKTKLIGHAKLAGQALLCLATYNLVRMGSLGGWWDAHHA